MGATILLVEDDRPVADLIEICLKNDGYIVYKCYNGTDALRYMEQEKTDLAILDIMLPDMDGFRICQKIREKYFFPIIMLTAKVESYDKILGLTMGADDYMTKPFDPLELLARVKTHLRRFRQYDSPEAAKHAQAKNAQYDIRGLVINKETHTCFLYGEELMLTPIEFAVLWYLCERRGRVVSSEELFEAVWGEKFYYSNKTVISHIGRIREKMKESAQKPNFIKTVWGVGYKIE